MSASQEYFQRPGHVLAAAIALPVVDTIAIVLRIWARRKQQQPLQADDWLMAPAVVLTVGTGVALVYAVSQKAVAYRVRIPEDFDGGTLDLVTSQIITMSQVEFACGLMLPWALGCTKLSILFLYRRIFSVARTGAIHIILAGLIVLVSVWMVAFFFAILFQCRLDIWAIWGSPEDLAAHCPGTMFVDLSLGITDFATDVILICIPAPIIWRLNIRTAHKVIASTVFLFGAVTIVASLIRLIMMAKLVVVGFDPDADEILTVTQYLYWGMIECGVGISAASLPVFQVLFRKLPWARVVQSTKRILRLGSSRPEPAKAGDPATNAPVEHTTTRVWPTEKGGAFWPLDTSRADSFPEADALAMEHPEARENV